MSDKREEAPTSPSRFGQGHRGRRGEGAPDDRRGEKKDPAAVADLAREIERDREKAERFIDKK